MTLIQEDSDQIEPSGAEGLFDDTGQARAAAPEVETPPVAIAHGSGASNSRFGSLPLAVPVSIALHLAVAAFFLIGPGRNFGSVLLSGIRDPGIASIGDAKAENAGSSRQHTPQDRAISVVLMPPVVPRPKAPPAAGRDTATHAPAEVRSKDQARQEAPSVLSANTAAPKAAVKQAVAPKPEMTKAVSRPARPVKPARPAKAAQQPQPQAQPKKTGDLLTFRQPFLLPAGTGHESWRGALTGSARGDHASTSKGTAEKGSGDAAVSNYPGRVARKLNGALSYPSGAKAARLTGQATVSFEVDDSGRVSAISIVASSGFAVLDKAAIEAVRRASPFPPIPSAANRRDWPFTVTLAFGK